MSSKPGIEAMLRRAGAVLLAAFLVWQFAGLLLLAFASCLVAIMLRAISTRLQRFTGMGAGWALLLACLVILGVAMIFFMLLGAQIKNEVSVLGREIPGLLSDVGNRLGVRHLDQRVLEWAEGLATHDGLMGRITATTSLIVSGFADVLLVVVAGVYLAVSPDTYRSGVLRLVPARWRDNTGHFMDTAGHALTLWLAGQLATMAAVGVLFAGGLFIMGVPSAIALGFIAGIAEFVPYAGPILGAIPALLIAIPMGRNEVLGVLGVYLAIQALEGNVLSPLIQKKAVNLPPVLTLFAIVAIGGLFGMLGLLLATPLTVIGFIAVKQFYLRDMLKQDASIPGEADPPAS